MMQGDVAEESPGSGRSEQLMESSWSNKDSPGQPTLAPILNRSLPGGCLPANKGTLTWGQDGLLAYGAHTNVVVVEPSTVQTFQCLTRHRSPVVSIAWGQVEHNRMQLASSDASGEIISWHVVAGEVSKQVRDGNQPVCGLAWLAGPGASHQSGEESLLLALHPPNHLVLWNMDTGVKVWKKSYPDVLLGISLDPFTVGSALLRGQTSFLFVHDLHPTKCPKSEGKKFYVTAGSRGSPGREGDQEVRPGKVRSARLRRMVKSMVLGTEGNVEEDNESAITNDCISAQYHSALPNMVLLAYSRELLLVDTDLGQTVGVISMERAHSPLAAVSVCSTTQHLLLLHESGSVSMWAPKAGLSVASTPMLPKSQSQMLLLPKSQSLSAFPSTPASSAAASSEAILEISYESRASSDNVRLGKNCRVLGLAVNPISETEAAFLTTDGRLFLLSLKTEPIPSLGLSSLLPCLPHPPLTVRMCPPLTVKNWADFQPLLAVGNATGHLLVVNVSTGVITRELAVHTAPVAAIEWTSSQPAASVLSLAHCAITGSNLVRNELVATDLRTGRTRHLRNEAGREPEEERVTMIRVSQGKQYFIVAFAASPFELWDLRKLCLLRTMPKKFPPISALVWSPLHSSKGRRGSGGSREGSPALQQQPNKEGGDGGQKSQKQPSPQVQSGKEHILLTDSVGQVYHFTVDAGSIRDGTKIPAEANMGTVTCISWKSDLIVRGDSEGNINIYNVKTRECKNSNTGRGSVRKIRFSPGKNNLKMLVLYTDWLQIWDARELELINEVRECYSDAEWASSDRVTLAGSDGTVRLAGLALAATSSSALVYGREQLPNCWGLLSKEKFMWIAHCLATNPVLDSLLANLNEEEEELVMQLLEYQGEDWLQTLQEEEDVSKRYLRVAETLGLSWEASLWGLLDNLKSGKRVPAGELIHSRPEVFRAEQEEKCKLHLSRAVERSDRVMVTAQLICLGEAEPAVGLLLDSDPGEENYMADQLLACLIQATAHTPPEGAHRHVSTVKMVATNLLSEGRLWEGVQLLALTGQVSEAVSYLRSAGHWSIALWLARLRLSEEDFNALTSKYCDFLTNQGDVEVEPGLFADLTQILGRVKEACKTHLLSGRNQAAIETLHLAQERGLAVRLLPLLEQACGQVSDNSGEQVDGKGDGQGVEELAEEQARLIGCLREAVIMEAARWLDEIGQRKAALECCETLGEKGKELKIELLAAIPPTPVQ